MAGRGGNVDGAGSGFDGEPSFPAKVTMRGIFVGGALLCCWLERRRRRGGRQRFEELPREEVVELDMWSASADLE